MDASSVQRAPGPPGPPDSAWASRDPVGETLHALRMDGVVYARSELRAPWGIALPPLPDCLMFHVVTSGLCRVRIAGEPELELRPGEFLLLPHGGGHVIASGPDVEVVDFFDLPVERPSPRYELLRHGGDGERTRLICGAVRFEHPAARELVRILPPSLHLDSWERAEGEWMHSTLRLMAGEAEAQRPGGETVVTRLADILVIQAIRSWLASAPAAHTGWLGALQDAHLGQAMVRMHRDPGHDWSVASLARAASMSRSAFAERFAELVGETPMHYLTRWRMHLAASWLREDAATAAACAHRLGYASEAAFHRAFKRVLGVTPGAWKRGAA